MFPLLPNARTADQASSHLARIATDPAFDGVTGKFFADGKERKSSDESYDVAKQERLWAFSERAIGTSSKRPSSAHIQ